MALLLSCCSVCLHSSACMLYSIWSPEWHWEEMTVMCYSLQRRSPLVFWHRGFLYTLTNLHIRPLVHQYFSSLSLSPLILNHILYPVSIAGKCYVALQAVFVWKAQFSSFEESSENCWDAENQFTMELSQVCVNEWLISVWWHWPKMTLDWPLKKKKTRKVCAWRKWVMFENSVCWKVHSIPCYLFKTKQIICLLYARLLGVSKVSMWCNHPVVINNKSLKFWKIQ